MNKKIARFGILAIFMIVSTMLALAQEENQQDGFVSNSVDLANKIGIPLKAEELHNPLLFFKSYGFTLILSLITLIALIFVIIPKTNELLMKNKTLLEFRKQRALKKEEKPLKKKAKYHERPLVKPKHRAVGIFHKLGLVKPEDVKREVEKQKREERERLHIKKEIAKKKATDYHKIRSKYKKIPKEAGERIKLEVAVARKLLEEKDSFSVSDVLKKIDDLYSSQLTRQERIDLYEDIKRWTSHGELCLLVKEVKGVKYYKFV